MRGLWMTGVELFNSVPGIGEIGQWFPAVITGIVAFPGNQVNSPTVPAFPHNLAVYQHKTKQPPIQQRISLGDKHLL